MIISSDVVIFPDPVCYALTRPINCRNGHNNGGNRESAVIFHGVLSLKKRCD